MHDFTRFSHGFVERCAREWRPAHTVNFNAFWQVFFHVPKWLCLSLYSSNVQLKSRRNKLRQTSGKLRVPVFHWHNMHLDFTCTSWKTLLCHVWHFTAVHTGLLISIRTAGFKESQYNYEWLVLAMATGFPPVQSLPERHTFWKILCTQKSTECFQKSKSLRDPICGTDMQQIRLWVPLSLPLCARNQSRLTSGGFAREEVFFGRSVDDQRFCNLSQTPEK